LGDCSVCHRTVCEKCGNTQFSHGERHVTHNACLKKTDGGFKMIKFVD
jgi:ribosomal protein L32